MYRKEVRKSINCAKKHSIDTIPTYDPRTSKNNERLLQIFSAIAKMLLHNMAEIEKWEVYFPVLCHLLAWEFDTG